MFGGLVVISLAVMFWGWAEKCIVQLLGLEYSEMPKYEALKFLGIGMGGVLLALQAVIANKRAKAMEKTATAQADAATAQAQATEEQATANKNTEQGQRQERLKNAIEHLGHDRDSVRLGGAYELFHLAEDEDTAEGKKDLRQTVLDILCAHIRWTTGKSEYRDNHPKPSEEIQSLLNLLFVQKHKVFTECDINLRGSWLNGSTLNQARLEKANLLGAHLHGAYLMRAQLQGAQLGGAQLHRAQFGGVQLHGANLIGAQLQGANLGEAQLHGAILISAQLHGAYLMRAQLHGADLGGAQLYGAILISAQLHGAILRGAHLHEAQLGGAQLHGAASRYHKNLLDSFEASINERIGEESDLAGAIFAGGLTQEDVDCIGKGLPDEDANELREKLKEHIRESKRYGLPENSDADQGEYTKEEAAQWIAEHKIGLA